MTPLEFLKSKGLIKEDNEEFIIIFEDGRSFELCKLFIEYNETVVMPLIKDIVEDIKKIGSLGV